MKLIMYKVEEGGVLECFRHATFLLVRGELVRCELIIRSLFSNLIKIMGL